MLPAAPILLYNTSYLSKVRVLQNLNLALPRFHERPSSLSHLLKSTDQLLQGKPTEFYI
jgi:hypothetical protein